MTLILSGTDGLSDIDGSAATPAIRGTDANTGIFFPAADTIAFAEGGAEAMRINSSGNVGIGTSSPTARLTLASGTNEGAVRVGDNATFYGELARVQATDEVRLGSYGGSQNLVFYTVSSERARIDSSGNLMVGVVAPSAKLSVSTSGNNYGIFSENINTATTSNYFYWAYSGATKFIVYGNGGIANYQANDVNLSDRTEKTDFAPAKPYLETICAIPVQTFKYIDQQDDELNLGVIAQDVQAVAPELVTESNWGTKEDPKMRLSIYQTDLQYALMKSIQELKAIVDAQGAEITALTTRITALEAA